MVGSTPLLPHQIRIAQVAEWLADSVNRAVTFHRTSRRAESAIVGHGVDVRRSEIGSYGQGFYTAVATNPFFGETDVGAAIRLRRPLVGHADEMANAIDDLMKEIQGAQGPITPAVAARIRTHLLRRGHGGIIVRDGGGDGIDYVIALENTSVRVVVQ